MPDVAKLKKKAAELELKKQFDKALAVYVEILDGFDDADDEVDVALYNRVGDMFLKQGNVADAVDYYEQAVDRYAEGGFFNNAIALCNKILRNSPGRASIYYKLGKISAQKGFKGDAKANYLEYADRMQQTGRIDEAFRALKEFADLCPDQDDIRLLLAEQLSKQERGPEAIEQLQLLYERYALEGRELEARATIDRMKAIDPTVKPRTSGATRRSGGQDLVFLDLTDGKSGRRSHLAKRATHGLDVIHTGEYQEVAAAADRAPAPDPVVAETPAPTPDVLGTSAMEPALLDGVTRAGEFERIGEDDDSGLLQGLQTMEFDVAPEATDERSAGLLDFEATDLGVATTSAGPGAPGATETEGGSGADLLAFELPPMGHVARASGQSARRSLPGLDMPDETTGPSAGGLDLPDDGSPIGGDLHLIMPDEEPPARRAAASLDDIPLLDLELPAPGEAAAGIAGTPVGGAPLEFVELAESESSAGWDLRGDQLLDEPDVEPAIEADAVPATEPEDSFSIPTPPAARRSSTIMAEHSVELLHALVEATPDDHGQRRRLAEAMLDSGDREGGLGELERAMVGFEREDDLASAASLADEIVRLTPESIRHHQKRVEYAFRTNERGRLIEAYLALADALFRAGQLEKSRAIYHRVLDLAPGELRAESALENFTEAEPEPPLPPARGRPTSPTAHVAQVPTPHRPPSPTPDDEFINLGDWLRDDDAPKDTRMVVEEKEPTGDEEADFQDMLRKFKQGIAENVEEEDHQSHYDLGIAYKEMGLLDEAIAEFQKALRSPTNRVPTYESLGQCFIDKEQYPMAATILGRALHEKGVSDEQLVGVLYLLGQCAEARGQLGQAAEYYQRVFVVDIQFRDVGDRLATVEGARP